MSASAHVVHMGIASIFRQGRCSILLINYASPHHITNRGKLPLHSMHESGKSITLDNGATLTFTLIASWHDMGTKMGSANRRKEGRAYEREDA